MRETLAACCAPAPGRGSGRRGKPAARGRGGGLGLLAKSPQAACSTSAVRRGAGAWRPHGEQARRNPEARAGARRGAAEISGRPPPPPVGQRRFWREPRGRRRAREIERKVRAGGVGRAKSSAKLPARKLSPISRCRGARAKKLDYENFGAGRPAKILEYGNFGAGAPAKILEYENFGAGAPAKILQYRNFGKISICENFAGRQNFSI